MIPIALSIAGSDPSGGAGIQADLKTFHTHGVYGQAVVSLLTVQSTAGVRRVVPVDDVLLGEQIAALWADFPPQAAKTGALPSAEAVRRVADAFRGRDCPLVVDPVIKASQGVELAGADVTQAIRAHLFPVATLITPNVAEAEALSGLPVRDLDGAIAAARALIAAGASAVLIKGGHLGGDDATDVLVGEDGTEMLLQAPRLPRLKVRGTGCTYSAAICAQLALGRDLPSAVRRAKAWLTRVLESPLGLGSPRGPVNHFVPVREP